LNKSKITLAVTASALMVESKGAKQRQAHAEPVSETCGQDIYSVIDLGQKYACSNHLTDKRYLITA
jgi:hypothetical protein